VKTCSAILQSQFLEGSSRGKVNAVSDSGKKAGNIDANRKMGNPVCTDEGILRPYNSYLSLHAEEVVAYYIHHRLKEQNQRSKCR